MKDKFEILKELHETFPQKFIDDFASDTPISAGEGFEVIKDHLKTVHNLSYEEINEIRVFLIKRNQKQYSLCEAVADIAYITGTKDYYGGDSREDIANFIAWAKEFEHIHRGVVWGEDLDYFDEIDKFISKKIKK